MASATRAANEIGAHYEAEVERRKAAEQRLQSLQAAVQAEVERLRRESKECSVPGTTAADWEFGDLLEEVFHRLEALLQEGDDA